MKRILLSAFILLLVSVLLIGCSATDQSTTVTATNTPSSSESLDGKKLVETRCTVCHSLDRATSFSGSTNDWTRVVDDMLKKGANLGNTEKETVINYLAETYP